MKRTQKLLALILTVLTVIGVFSVATPVVAADLQSANAEEIVPADEDKVTEEPVFAGEDAISEEADNEPTVLGEDESRRTADTKHFIMSDGTRKAVIYGNAVHFEENGKWEEIDNTLSYDKDKKEYKNKKNSFKATFKENFNDENMFTLENEGYEISWEYDGSSLRKAFTKAEYKEGQKSEDEITKYAHQSEDKIRYKNFEADCELEYVVTGNGVKENIILNSKPNKNEFAFNVTADGLTLVKNSDGSISALNSEKNEIFYLPAPFMYDSDGVYSYDVFYEIAENNGKYIITVVADKNWLEDDERAYPVVVDPVIYTERKSSDIKSTFVASEDDTNKDDMRDLYLGVDTSGYGICRTLLKFDLPTLNKGDMVVGATLALCMYGTSFYTSTMPEQQINAHLVTSEWDENTVKWSNQPSINSVVTDYDFFSNTDLQNGETSKCFDITKLVKGWYEGTYVNNGIMLKKAVETGNNADVAANCIFWSDKYNNVTSAYPVIAIDYRNNKGIESYWSYTSYSDGVSGTASINDYTGNLVYTVPLTSSVSEIMPVSLSLVYNNYCSSEIYTAGKNNSNLTSVGKGWRLNYQQTLLTSAKYGLTGTAAENYPYVYTDGDGTEHYIAKFTENGQTIYKDEDGLGYTFSKPNTTNDFYRLTRDDGSYMSFNNCGNISQIVDNSGNKITITYDSYNLMIQKITDGTGHTFTFTYTNGTNYLSTIKDNAGRATTLTISSGALTDISLIDGSKVYFRYYTTDDKPLYYVWNTDKTGRSFVYTTRATGSRISRTMDFSASDVSLSNYLLGQVTTFDRSLYNTTTIRTPGIDGVHMVSDSTKANDDIVTTLQFDNYGRTVSQQASYGWGEEIGAGAYTYTGDDKKESRNRIASSATLNKNTHNLLVNPSAESLTGYYINSVGDVAYTSACTNEEAYYGTKSIKVNTTSMSQYSYVRIGQSMTTLKVNHYYTYSAYVKIPNISLRSYRALQGAVLEVVPRDSSGAGLNYLYSAQVKNVTSEDIDNGWRRISVRFCVPENTASVDVRVLFVNAIGTIYVDGLQLEESITPSSVNLLENASFEQYSSTGITSWAASSGITYSQNYRGATSTAKKEGSASLKITGLATHYVGFTQTIPIAPNENDTYIVSGWGAAYAVNHTFHPNAKFEIAVRVTYKCSDGSTVTQYKDSAEFNTSVANWQYASSAFSVKYQKESGDTKTYTPTHILVMPRYNLQANYAYFDHIQLIKDVASSYIYDSEGNVTSVSANAQQKNNMTYEGEDLKTYTDAADYTTTYTYDSNHRLTQVKSPRTIKTNYIYNNKGQVVSTELQDGGAGIKIKTYQDYTTAYNSGTTNLTAGAYLYHTTDAVGNTTTYGHNLPTGVQTSVEDAKGNKTTYGYNDNYTRLLGVSGKPVASENNYTNVNYTYDGNRVKEILFSGTDGKNETYKFDYDDFGNVKKTFVGSTALVENEYGTNNGLLEKSTYANGDAIRYKYSYSGLVTDIFVDDNVATEYATYCFGYSSNGTPTHYSDGPTATRYDYNYDSIGRLIRTNISNNKTFDYKGSTEYGYDVRNNLTSISNDIGGVTYNQEYLYSATTDVAESAAHAKDNLPTQYKYLDVKMNYYHDSLNRLYKRVVGTQTNLLTNQYYYTTTTGTDGVTYYSTQLNREVIEDVTYNYSYDKAGNITGITKALGTASPYNYRSYSYDGLNRMVSEHNHTNKQVVRYTYDGLGNITQKQIDTYTNTTLTGSYTTKVINYTYGNDGKTGWNNLLTSYDANSNGTVDTNEKISYDSIGNPVTYRGATLSWYGRQLTQFVKNGVTSKFTYDADGLRTTKTVGTAKTEYQYVGDKLFYEKRGDGNSFYYFYDSYGKLSAIYHHVNGTMVAYHVVTNAQGDVMALYNWTGDTKVAEYSYDAWGNCTILSDTTSTHIATLNPFRYRSYYYDSDLGLYYLQSRYYDAEIGRFINADGYITTGQGVMSYNMYAYCGNNPVNRYDNTGEAFKDWWIVKKYREFKKEHEGKFKVFKKVKSAIDTGIKVTKQEELYIHAQNVHDLNYYKNQGNDLKVKSPNMLVFGIGEQYQKRCENLADTYIQFAECNGFNIEARPWDNLNEYEKDVMALGAMHWDTSVALGYKYFLGFEGGLGFAKNN